MSPTQIETAPIHCLLWLQHLLSGMEEQTLTEMIISLSQYSYALKKIMVLYYYFQREGDLKIIRKPILLQTSYTLSQSLQQVRSQYPHRSFCARTLRRQEVWHYIKIGIFFFDGFFRSNQFCDADNGENYNSRDSKQEALLNFPLKPAQLFTKVNAFRVKFVSHLCVNGITSM